MTNAASRVGRVLLTISAVAFASGVLLIVATYVALDGQAGPLFGGLLLLGLAFVTGVLGLIPTLTGATSRGDSDAG